MTLRGALILALALLWATPAPAGDEVPGWEALKGSQAVIGNEVRNYALVNSEGEEVHIAKFRGKPLLVNFIYTSCNTACPIITDTLADFMDEAEDAVGLKSFEVLTLGFDAGKDRPDTMGAFARRHGIDFPNWHFVSGDLPSVAGLVEELGFTYYRSPKGFDHISQVTVIDQSGVIYRQIYGEQFELPKLIEPIKELIWGTRTPFASVDDLVKKVKLFCVIYDPARDRYKFDYSVFAGMFAGFLVITWMVWFVGKNWLRLYRRDKERARRGEAGV